MTLSYRGGPMYSCEVELSSDVRRYQKLGVEMVLFCRSCKDPSLLIMRHNYLDSIEAYCLDTGA